MEQNVVQKLEEDKARILNCLLNAGLDEEISRKYSGILIEHEIDESILKSKLLNHALLKEIGVNVLGHRLKILSIGHREIERVPQDEQQQQEEEDKMALTLDSVLQPPAENPGELELYVQQIAKKQKELEDIDAMEQEKRSEKKRDREEEEDEEIEDEDTSIFSTNRFARSSKLSKTKEEEEEEEENEEEQRETFYRATQSKSTYEKLIFDSTPIQERAKYIPVRLSQKERKQLRLLEAALNVSEYTDKVDILSYEKKSKRAFEQLKDICAILSGLLVASDYHAGQRLVTERKFKDNAQFFQDVFEVGRRHKIMNPEKMRSEYGKLMYLLQDAASAELRALLEFDARKPISTVYGYLQQRDALGVLSDSLILYATDEIPDDKSKPRHEIQQAIKRKEKAVEKISATYASPKISPEEIKLCLRSIGDNNSYLRQARDPVERMIYYLTHFFHPNKYEEGYSLDISFGKGGSRLSHDHPRQYSFVLQSLVLWREITNDMFRLWHFAEEDLLDVETYPYRLTNTGQGLNRVQSAARVGKAMHRILNVAQTKVGTWVGSSVVHLGDHNVPNALNFIDKYAQVERILNPINITVQNIDQLVKDPGLKHYIDTTFGGKDKLRKDILVDFFRFGFDGSGADNFFDAGSCIDGRLTSAWNWCSKLSKKPFYPIFLLCGFIGFDGDFQK